MTMTSIPLRVLILGTGALAKLIGFRLATARESDAPLAAVTLAGDWTVALEAIAAGGIVLEESDGRVGQATVDALTREALTAALGLVDHPASTDPQGPDDPGRAGVPSDPRDLSDPDGLKDAFDLVLVLVKSRQTAAVAPLAAAAAGAGGRILSLQNGLGNRELLQAAAGDPDRVLSGMTSVGATGLGPNKVRAGGLGVTRLGPSRGPGPSAEAIARLFSAAGLPCAVSPDVDALIWRKLAVSCAINPLTALTGLPNGALLADARLRSIANAAAREAVAVATALGIQLGADGADLVAEVAERTATNRSSMLQDLDRGAPTEIDAICGAVVARATALGLAAPVNAWLLRAVHRLESGGERAAVDWSEAAAASR